MWSQHEAKTAQKKIMDGVYIPPKKVEGSQHQNKVIINHSPGTNDGDTNETPCPWSSHQNKGNNQSERKD